MKVCEIEDLEWGGTRSLDTTCSCRALAFTQRSADDDRSDAHEIAAHGLQRSANHLISAEDTKRECTAVKAVFTSKWMSVAAAQAGRYRHQIVASRDASKFDGRGRGLTL